MPIPASPTSPGLSSTFDPVSSGTLRHNHVIEVVFTKAIQASTVTTSTVLVSDDTAGHTYTPTVSVTTSGSNSRIVIKPDRDWEWGHRIRVEVTSSVTFTDSQIAGGWVEFFTVEDGPRPRVLWETHGKTLLLSRESSNLQPWERGFDDTLYAGHRLVGMRNASRYSADWLLTQTAGAVSGAPATPTAARTAFRQFSEEMSGAVASAWLWLARGATADRDAGGAFVLDWAENFTITPRYSTDRTNHPWDAMLWDICIIKMCYWLDLMWGEGSVASFGDVEKGAIKTALSSWASILGNQWKADLDDVTQPGLEIAWTNTAVAAIAEILGDYKMRAWALDGSLVPDGWTYTNAKPLTWTEDNLFTSTGAYVNEAIAESKDGRDTSGQGYTAALSNLNAHAWHYIILTNRGTYRWDTVNTYGNTLKVSYDLYADYANETLDWATRYPGHVLSDYQLWSTQQVFFKGAYHYRSTPLQTLVNERFGVDKAGNTVEKPWGHDAIQHVGGTCDYLPDPLAMITDTTPPNEASSLAVADKGATWMELTWTRSAVSKENDIPKWYEVIDDAAPAVVLHTVRDPATVVSGLTANTEYTFRVKPVDYAGNKGSGITITATTDTV